MLFFFVLFPISALDLVFLLLNLHFVFAAFHFDHLVFAAFPALADLEFFFAGFCVTFVGARFGTGFRRFFDGLARCALRLSEDELRVVLESGVAEQDVIQLSFLEDAICFFEVQLITALSEDLVERHFTPDDVHCFVRAHFDL